MARWLTNRNRQAAPAVVLSDVRPEYADGVQASTALVSGGLAGEGFRLRLRLHGDGPLDHSATPFLPLLAILAAASGTDGVVDGSVDAAALDGAERAMAVQAGFFDLRAPKLQASEVVAGGAAAGSGEQAAGGRQGRGTGLFFSRGVDSMATFLTDRSEITHFIVIDWVDAPYLSEGLVAATAGTRAAAESIGVPLLRVTSNARQLLDANPGWLIFHGQLLAAFALLLSPQLAEVRISSTVSAGDPTPNSVHELSTDLWSSSRTAVVHRHAVTGTRVDKTALVAGDDWAMRWLNVCFTKNGEGNCGACPKCLLTMTTLDLVGAGDRLGERFDAPLTVEAVRACAETVPRTALENQRSLIDRLDDGPMRDAWRQVLANTEAGLAAKGSALERRIAQRRSDGE